MKGARGSASRLRDACDSCDSYDSCGMPQVAALLMVLHRLESAPRPGLTMNPQFIPPWGGVRAGWLALDPHAALHQIVWAR
jgi:hypothetical protein